MNNRPSRISQGVIDKLMEENKRLKTCAHNPKHNQPATTDFFYRDGTKKDGLSINCKKCISEMRNERNIKKMAEDGPDVPLTSYKLEYLDSHDRLQKRWFKHKKGRGGAEEAFRRIPKHIEVDGFILTRCAVLCRKGE